MVYPLILEPVVLEKPWGSQGAATGLVPGLSADLKVGEIWLNGDGKWPCKVLNGHMAGSTLEDLRNIWGTRLLGERFQGRETQPLPILLKYLHASDYLSVQVHPDDVQAGVLEGSSESGKAEAWYIFEARPESELILGLKNGDSPDGFPQKLAGGNFAAILNRTLTGPGETFYIHPGRLHSIGPGVTLFEIQQNSDLTYRFYDWDRVDENGLKRELHLEKATAVVDLSSAVTKRFTGLAYEKNGHRVTALAAGRHFYLEKLEIRGSWAAEADPVRFEILTLISGHGQLTSGDARFEETDMPPGRAVLLPAMLGRYSLTSRSGAVLLRAVVPDLMDDVVRPLRNAGFPDSEIIQLAGVRRPNDLSEFFG